MDITYLPCSVCHSEPDDPSTDEPNLCVANMGVLCVACIEEAALTLRKWRDDNPVILPVYGSGVQYRELH